VEVDVDGTETLALVSSIGILTNRHNKRARPSTLARCANRRDFTICDAARSRRKRECIVCAVPACSLSAYLRVPVQDLSTHLPSIERINPCRMGHAALLMASKCSNIHAAAGTEAVQEVAALGIE
jgi:hypothetical protein